MTKITVTTDFGIPSSRLFASEAEARAYGEYCIRELGCTKYVITRPL